MSIIGFGWKSQSHAAPIQVFFSKAQICVWMKKTDLDSNSELHCLAGSTGIGKVVPHYVGAHSLSKNLVRVEPNIGRTMSFTAV